MLSFKPDLRDWLPVLSYLIFPPIQVNSSIRVLAGLAGESVEITIPE
jgi:hypothetical protein